MREEAAGTQTEATQGGNLASGVNPFKDLRHDNFQQAYLVMVDLTVVI